MKTIIRNENSHIGTESDTRVLPNTKKKQYPCQYTTEEVQTSSDASVRAFKAGEMQCFTSQEDMRKRHSAR
ncbi:hypothetical protein LJC05_04580 [Bacteroides sp. OttesenSCG-928-J23]|nr:hypothetical protein [Bacteroides sp. OttesenSCG-928-J23]MDL2305873.1 hypothetical protein [Bacteroides sp. OttesenSCG-928-D19]